MSREYINKEIDEIMSSSFEYPKNMAMSSAWIMGNLKGLNLKVLKMGEEHSLTDFFVIGSAQNYIQARSMADEISFQLKRHKAEVRSKEGNENSDWILIDFGDIIVHIFIEHARSDYNLESLWKESTEVEIPQEYYFDSEDSLKSETLTFHDKNRENDEDYF